jgi:hypothetical protein
VKLVFEKTLSIFWHTLKGMPLRGVSLQVVMDGQGNLAALDVHQLEKLLILLLERKFKFLASLPDGRDASLPCSGPTQSRDVLSQLSPGGVGLIHFAAALGYDWAVNILLQGGANVQLKVDLLD